QVFAFHERPGAFRRLTPPYERVEVERREGSIRNGDRTVLRMRLGPLSRRWVAEHRGYEAGRQFVDVQVSGPFARWEHLHRVEPNGDGGSVMIDRVRYALPLGGLGAALGKGMVEKRLKRMFAYRHEVLAHDAQLHARAAGRTLKVAMTGASGLLGTSLTALLESGGHTVVPLVRGEDRPGIQWSPRQGTIDRAALEGFDAVVHLAGENLAQRWSEGTKERIRASRWQGTKLLANAIAELERPPATFVSMSAVGFYGASGDAVLDESSARGDDFLAEVCVGWEEASRRAEEVGVRVVNPRMGVVLSPAGGALSLMKIPFWMGLGGRVGDGAQYMSWVGIDDAVGALYWALLEPSLRGPVNVTAPEPVTNRRFTDTLGRVLRRPTPFPLPAAVVKLALGEMGEATLLGGQRVQPTALEASGYPFAHRRLEDALRHLLGRPV
ncbi:MAG TPA: TIGR01777 family oxidoreductase, partial [Sandaracinaceae bacterium LLY-WYZ-13_1]|nr:TIGR01777 family oxidoreductase [Sandaracinaceae bacterium LLY-WYZ-13_1]